MTAASDYHKMAMEFADLGLRYRARGNGELALAYFEQALDFELAAIAGLEQTDGLAGSVLYRSAGTLALDCRRFRQAEQITAQALAGEPHPDIAEELRDLWEQIYFQRHLDLNGVALQNDELQMSLSGSEVSRGLAPHSAIYGRVDNTGKLIHRTAERKLGRQFREGGQPVKEVRDNYRMMVSVPREGSFAVTLKFGSLIQPAQPALTGMFDVASVMDEFMQLIGLVNQSRDDVIQDLIADEAYLRNFFNLAKRIAPDGESIRQVGFTAIRNGSEHSVALTRPADEIIAPSPTAPPDADEESVVIRGVLRFADAISGSDAQIRVVDSEGKPHPVDVPAGMMNDIVRPMWDERVVIQGMRAGNRITMVTIDLDVNAAD